MSVPAFLAKLRAGDIQVWAEGDRLRCNAPANSLTPELRAELQRRKEEILQFLRTAGELSKKQRAIVPLQQNGRRTPIFGIPGHNGDVFCYRLLSQHLGNDQPFYGLQPPGLDGRSVPLTRVEDLAAYFSTQLRAFLPGGPYILAGFCAGSTIAFELGQQLLREGAAIRFLALFGASYPSSYRLGPALRQFAWDQTRRIILLARTLISLSPAQQRAHIAEIFRKRKAQRAAERSAAQDSVVQLRTRLENTTISAIRGYHPDFFPGRLNMLFPCKDWVHCGTHADRWRHIAQHVEEHFGPDGCRSELMLREPYARVFAELLSQCCAKYDENVTVRPPTSRAELDSAAHRSMPQRSIVSASAA